MTVLNLTGQRTVVNNALPTFQAFQTQMNLRREIWNKLTPEMRKKWIQSSSGTLNDAKDPVMWLAINLRNYLVEWELENND